MSQTSINKTESNQIEDSDSENSFHHSEINSHTVDEGNNSNESPWSTRGYMLGESSISPCSSGYQRPIVEVLPRRLPNGGMFSQLIQQMRDAEDVQVFLEPEELLSDPEDDDGGPEEALIIGRNHPDSSEAALAGYRYRII
ncbi:uncharacterized protein LOC110177892 isoform X2 [Drosophila serrata]|uniref:uncharacterized protein LOC110177892 isoform X2 n=1 Tax=Drosophila serrata TaxID=7274 RepID=UPI000A1D115B|nr:uncharacterized protein LOC110177892 isoform X2 [Drosophila serrata]